MDFRSTPQNVTSLLLVALGILAAYFLGKKRFDSNLTILFYLFVLAYSNWTDRHVNTYLYGAGLALALLLRFEFMNVSITKVVLALEMIAVIAINLTYLSHVFS